MASESRTNIDIESKARDYSGCLITPMTNEDGKPLIRPVHLVDALIVSMIVFFSLLLGTALPNVLAGDIAYIGPEEIGNRLLTAGLAFGLTFFAQWARYRGIQMIKIFNGDQ